MTISELQILLDINKGNERALLKEHASLTMYGYLFVDSIDGHCYLFDYYGQLSDIKKIDAMLNGYVKKDIKKIVIPNYVKSIGAWAFKDCTSLTRIKIPDNVESIGYQAFAFCTSLTSIEIPESVKSIGKGAFYNCISLTSIIFKDKTIDQVKTMNYYPWGIEDESIISIDDIVDDIKARRASDDD